MGPSRRAAAPLTAVIARVGAIAASARVCARPLQLERRAIARRVAICAAGAIALSLVLSVSELHQLQLPPAEVSATAFAVNLGGGVTYAVTPRVGVRGDFRYVNYTHGESSDPGDLVIIDDVPSAWRFAGALTLRLGS